MTTFNKIQTLLKEQHKTQKQLMEYLGLGKTAFTGWKNGANTSYLKHIGKIAEFFGVSTDYLLGIEPKLNFTAIESPVVTFSSDETLPKGFFNSDIIATHSEKEIIREYRTKPEKQKAINHIIEAGNSAAINNETLMFALWGGDTDDITPEMLDDVRKFAQFIREKKKDGSQ